MDKKEFKLWRHQLGCLAWILGVIGIVLVVVWYGVKLRRITQAERAGRSLALLVTPASQKILIPEADGFDYPMGTRAGGMIYNARGFGDRHHLGADFNGVGGKDTDLGDLVYASGHGLVLFAGEGGLHWGGVVLLEHRLKGGKTLQTLYGHLDEIRVKPGEIVLRGQELGTVGNVGGRYYAHLHFEVREHIGIFIGPGYRKEPVGWLDPEEFLQNNPGGRKIWEWIVLSSAREEADVVHGRHRRQRK